MKRVYILLALLLCAMFAFSAQAIEVEPGQTFTLPISVFSGNKLACAEFTVTYDASTFTMVSCSVDERYMDFDPLDGHYVLLRLRGILDGQVGSVTLRVNAGAKAGTYNLGVIRGMLLDIDENDIDKEVSFGLGGSITVKVDCKHDKTEDKIIKAATCDTAGEKQIVCSDCGEVIKTETIDKLNHKLGAYEVTKPATCTEKGVETAKCERCSYTKTRSIDALDHKVGEFEVTKPATCTEDGEKTAKCERCSHTVTEVITKLNHKVGEFEVTKPATCTEDGEKTAKCERCSHTVTEVITKLGHKVGKYEVTKPATCTEDGEKTAKCERCDYAVTETIAALGHNGVWKVIKPATGKEEGLKQKICKRCGEILEEAVIPILRVESRNACTAGVKASELTYLKADYDWWKMVTAIDLSVEGTTRYPLIAGNVYEIGYVEITVEDGVVTADAVVEAPTVVMYTNALIFLADASEITFFDPSFYEYYEFPATINVEDLPAEKVYMMVCCQLTIDLSKPEPKYYNFKGAEHLALVEQVNAIIAEMNAAE